MTSKLEDKISFTLPRDEKIRERYLKAWMKIYEKLIEDHETNLPGVTTWKYFIGIDEFGDLECFQRAANLSYADENSPLVRANGIPIVGNTTQASLNELDKYGTLSFKTKEERNDWYDYLTWRDKRLIRIDPTGPYLSHHKCPECGEKMNITSFNGKITK